MPFHAGESPAADAASGSHFVKVDLVIGAILFVTVPEKVKPVSQVVDLKMSSQWALCIGPSRKWPAIRSLVFGVVGFGFQNAKGGCSKTSPVDIFPNTSPLNVRLGIVGCETPDSEFT